MSLFSKKNTPVSGEAFSDPRVAENCKKVTLDNGIDIPYCEFGEENEDIIITGAVYFITYNEFLKELAKKYHVYGFIMRLDGEGDEKNPDGSINWTRQWGKDIYEAAKKLGLNRYHYVGKCHSAMPGWYIIKEHPDCLLSMTSISASLHAFPPDADQWTERQKADGPKFALNSMKKKQNLPKKVAEAKTVGNTGFQGSQALSNMAKYGSHSEEVLFGDYAAVKEFIATIKTPVCHIFASDDILYYDFKSSNEYAMYHTPGAKFVMLQGEKHLMEMDMPVLLAREVCFFIEGTTLKYE